MSEKTVIIHGNPISPGLAEGKIHVHRTLLGPIDVAPQSDSRHNVEEELGSLDLATSKITDDLLSLALRVEKEIDARLSKVFEVHQLILHDASLKKELRQEIVDNLVSAGSAVKTVFLRWEKRFMMMESQIARSKSDDFRDIEIRLRNALAGITVHPLEQIPYGCILATSRLLPSDTIFLVGRSTAAVLLEYGSVGSHAALFARELGVPCISGIANLQTTIPDGAFCLVDADTGVFTIRPDEEQITVFRKKVDLKNRLIEDARKDALAPAVTKNGIRINVLANVKSEDDTSIAIANGAEGVGLYRMEQTYLGSIAPPSTGELLNVMRETLRPATGRDVCVRLLDIGADKPMPYMEFMAETNPSLGRRGIRLLREYPQLLTTHLQAVLELSREFNVSVLVPMVTIPDDVAMVKNYLRQLASQLSISPLPRLGAMIETPAAALSAREIAKHVDFLSFGTNDLTQYAFAADRENAAVEMYFNDSSDVIFRMLKIVHEDVPEMPLSICGELGGRSEYIGKLLQCGITTFSVAPPLVPIIKETIRKTVYG
jgi:phosphoenolpyruvate-protein phosphotransferase